ncbi:signal transduction histidine kinase [Kitasatospora sp. SolWspMP-SS2h]|uniref:sensor histidine kinase n=1 Tax=Kitasatospora sp. SolWspMP-SS2h TaxID=1305729 RepID=UPI000DBFC062|nr:HAMP domain-containing sensor histidine kinase [Kitasatospora sp. SolWspMP-SS2h]RAJ36788.1 signal transduction histidine kinase [Kitasatospora sp. SolWspMP-SS2h]
MKAGPAPRTLRGGLARAALAASALWIAVATVAFNALLGSQLRTQADDVLHARAEAVLGTVEVRPDGLRVHDPADDAALDTGVWILAGDRAVEEPGAGGELDAAARALAARATAPRTEDHGAHRLHAVPVPDPCGHRAGTVVAALSTSPYRTIADTALAGSAALALLLLAGIHLLTRRMVRRALRPVADMAAQAAAWSGSDLTRRFGAAPRPRELAALAGHLDALLDRLAALVRHEQRLSNELSHELRTPLARIAAETEWLRGGPRAPADLARTHEAIARDAATMREICRTLLADARPGTTPPPAATAVRPAVEALAADLRRTRPHPAVTVTCAPAAADRAVAAPAPLVRRILCPLLDNARRHARDRITITVETDGDRGVRVAVADDGDGPPTGIAGIEEAVFAPGFRAEPDDGHDGAGLGLALSRRLARQAGGDVVCVCGAGGGRFEVILPGCGPPPGAAGPPMAWGAKTAARVRSGPRW